MCYGLNEVNICVLKEQENLPEKNLGSLIEPDVEPVDTLFRLESIFLCLEAGVGLLGGDIGWGDKGFRGFGVESSSMREVGRGGTSSDGRGLLGRDLDLDRDEVREANANGIPNRVCKVFRAAEGFGVVGRDG